MYFKSPTTGDTLVVFDESPFTYRKDIVNASLLLNRAARADTLILGERKGKVSKKMLVEMKPQLDKVLSSYKNILFSGVKAGSLYAPVRKIDESLFTIFFNGDQRIAFTESPANLYYYFYENFSNIILADIKFLREAVPFRTDNIEFINNPSLDELKAKLALEINNKLCPIALDIESTGLMPWKRDQKIISFSCASEETRGFNITLDHPRFSKNKDALECLQYVCSLPNPKVIHNSKFEYLWIEKLYGIPINGILFDTMLMSHQLNENLANGTKRLSLGGSIALYLNEIPYKEDFLSKINTGLKPKKIPKKDLTEDNISGLRDFADSLTDEVKNKDFTLMSEDDLLHYGVLDSISALRVFKNQARSILNESREGWNTISKDLHGRLTRALGTMEYNGMQLDTDRVMSVITQCDGIIKTEGEFLDQLSPGTNFLSKQGLSAHISAVCPELEPRLEKDTRGDYILDKAALKGIIPEYPWLKNLIHYRQGYKVRGTYMVNFLETATEGKVHFNFNVSGTATGRLSCDRPNMQNIPKKIGDKDKDGYELNVKGVLVPEANHLLVNMDLATAEIRMMANYSHDENLIKNINSGLEFHSMTASQIFGVDYELIAGAKNKRGELTKEEKEFLKMRNAAKAVSFGIPYGTTAGGLALRQGWDEKHAQDMIDKFFKLYPGVERWIEESKQVVNRDYKISTHFGRIRHFDVLRYNPSRATIGRIHRQAVNFLIQSSTSDFFQYFIYDLVNQIPGIIPHITVHDSLVFSVNPYIISLEDLRTKIYDIMVNGAEKRWPGKWVVPMLFDIEVGPDYGSTREVS